MAVTDSPWATPDSAKALLRADLGWLTVLEGPLIAATERHIILLQGRDLLAGTRVIGEDDEDAVRPSDLSIDLDWTRRAVAGHCSDILDAGGLSDLVREESPWLLPRVDRLLLRHAQLETMLSSAMRKLEVWPPSGIESYSSQIVSGELRIAGTLLEQVLMEEYYLEASLFDTPPALD